MAAASLVNLEAEQALLGAVLTDNSTLAHVGRLGPEHFGEALHARIFEATASLIRSGGMASALTLATSFKDDATMAAIGGVTYLARLVAQAAPAIGIPTLAAQIVSLHCRRETVVVANHLAALALDMGPGSFRENLAGSIGELSAIIEAGHVRRTSYGITEVAADVLARVERMRAGHGDPDAIPTGLASLDRMTGGMRRGELLILGGRPSMGKTALGAVIAANVTQSGRGVVYFSLEMPVGLLVPRFLSARVWGPAGPAVAYQRILRGAVSADEARWLKSASEDFSAWPLVIDDDAGLGVGEIEARSRVIASRMQAKGQSLDLVVVDHLHRMRVPNATSRVNELSAISAGLAEAAKRLNCPVLALAQLNRGVETRDDKRPTLADLRESGSIEQDADLVAFAYRPGYYLERQRCSNPADEADRLADMEREGHKLELLIAKQRSGPIGTVDLWCDLASNVVIDAADLHSMGRAA